MFVAVSKHTTAGAKRFVEDRGIDLRPRRKRESVAEISRRWQMQQAWKAEQERRMVRAAVERETAARLAKETNLAGMMKLDNPPARAVIADVAHRHGVAPADITSTSRTRKVVAARHEAIAEVYRRCRIDGREYTLSELGRAFKRDHATILYALRKAGHARDGRGMR